MAARRSNRGWPSRSSRSSALMVGASFAAVPFYSWFCRVTGYGGTTGVAAAPRRPRSSTALVTVSFDANTAPGHALGVPAEAALR